ncbi:MAG TPA: YhjD/YihY/BrkB family envelope integrity protein [Azonexus sp.]|nr:YhjD/YihY/BrkB family envelope integrity protein [Azonexus sp.]
MTPLQHSPAVQVLTHPLSFALNVVKRFQANQGLLLAGAIAYYTLLSLVPLLILCGIVLSHLLTPAELTEMLGRYLEWLVPSQSTAFLDELSRFLDKRVGIGAVLLATMIFFSSLTFSVLQKSFAVIFAFRCPSLKRSSLLALLLPYGFVALLGLGLVALTLVSIAIQTLTPESIVVFGRDWPLAGLSGNLLYILGLAAEALSLAAIYHFAPDGRIPLRHALVGGFTAAALWEIIRHLLVWYFTTLSKASVVYGSLTSTVVALFSLEIGATVLLLGAQTIAEYERLGQPPAGADDAVA